MHIKPRVAGVGMIPFQKPGQSEDWDVMAEQAIRLALADAGLEYSAVDPVEQLLLTLMMGMPVQPTR